jgi:hypothetical protein
MFRYSRSRMFLTTITVIISIWGGAVQSSSQSFDVEKVVRQRVTAYWEAMERNDYETASAFVHPDSRKQFIYRVPKGQIISWRLDKLTFNEDKTTCDTMISVTRPIPFPIDPPPAIPVQNRWVLAADGEWYFVIPWKEGENPFLEQFRNLAAATAKPPVSPEPSKAALELPERFVADPANPTVLHRGDPGTFRYHYRNAGSAPIKILSAGADCHCTSVQENYPEVPPGQSDTLEIRLDTFGLPLGSIEKMVTVVFSDLPKPLVIDLRVKNLPNFTLTPTGVDFGTVKLGSPTERTVQVVNESGRKVKFLSTFKAEPQLDVILDKSEVGPGETLTVTVRCNPVQAGEFMDSPMLRTDLAAEPVLNIPIRGKITL